MGKDDAARAMRVIADEAVSLGHGPEWPDLFLEVALYPSSAQVAGLLGVEKLSPEVEDARRVWNRYWRDSIHGVLEGKTADEVLA